LIYSTAIAVLILEGSVTELRFVSIALINEYNKDALNFASLKIGFQEMTSAYLLRCHAENR